MGRQLAFPTMDMAQAAVDTDAYTQSTEDAAYALELLSAEMEDVSDAIAGSATATMDATEAYEDAETGLKRLTAMSLSSTSSLEGLASSFIASTAAAAGVPAPIAALVGRLAKMKGTLIGNTLSLVEFGEGMVEMKNKGIAALKDLAMKGFQKMAQLGIAALKNLAKVAVKVFKKLLSFAVELAKKVGSALWSMGVNIAKGAGIALAALLALPIALDQLFRRTMVGAAKLVGVNNAFLAIAREGAPAMLQALIAGSAGMVTQTDLMEQYVSASLLAGKAMADQLPEALGYLTKISLATGEKMSYLIDSLVRGVGRLSPKILDNLKIQVSLAEATAWASEEYGKAADQLSVYEKQVGMMAVAMEKLEAKTSGLADATDTLTHLMAMSNILQAEGATMLASHFLPVAKAFYKVQIKLAQAFKASISEGGAWYNTIRKVSAAATALIELTGELVSNFSTGGADAIDAFADKMFEGAWNAFTWGANIINNLAIGMVQGITTSLMAAINAVSNFLSYWLSPGSAPKIVPNLLSWGASTFTEYLKGFAMADFDILTGVQAPLESALRNLVALGTISKEDAGNMFINLTHAMTEAIASGEEGWEGLAQVGGEYGDELVELFKRQMAMAKATKAVEEAEKRLVAARNLEEASGKRLSRQARDYNRLLKAGASDEILRQKLAEMKATYKTLEGARDAAEVAEDDKKIAEERAKEARALMQLQNALLQQMIKMGQVWASMADGGPGAVPGLDPDDLFPEDWEAFVPSVDQAFIDLTKRIKERFQALWDDLKADWEASGVGKLIEDLKAKWAESSLKEWWDEFMFDVKEEGIKLALQSLWLKIGSTTQSFLDDKFPVWGDIWRAFTQTGIEDGTGRVNLGAAFAAMWEAFKAGTIELAEKFGVFLGYQIGARLFGFYDETQETHDGERAGSFWQQLGQSFISGLAMGFVAALVEKYTRFTESLDGMMVQLRAHLGIDALWITGKALIGGLLRGISDRINEINWAHMGRTIRDRLASGLSGISGVLRGVFNSVIATIERAFDHVVTGVNAIIRAIRVIPGAGWIPTLSYIDFPRLAQGGLVTATEQLALLHGPEIVLPLNSPATQQVLSEAMIAAQGGEGGQQVTIHNHFGAGSIRSSKDILLVADAIQKSLELRGVRARIG